MFSAQLPGISTGNFWKGKCSTCWLTWIKTSRQERSWWSRCWPKFIISLNWFQWWRVLQLKFEMVVMLIVSHAQYSSPNPQHLYSKHNRSFFFNLLTRSGWNKHVQIYQNALNYLFYIPVSLMELNHGETASQKRMKSLWRAVKKMKSWTH